MAMDFVCYVERTAPALGNCHFAGFGGLEIPYCVWVFWVLEQLVGCHGPGRGSIHCSARRLLSHVVRFSN